MDIHDKIINKNGKSGDIVLTIGAQFPDISKDQMDNIEGFSAAHMREFTGAKDVIF